MKKLRWPLLIAILAVVAIALLLSSQKGPLLTPIDEPVIEPASGGIYTEGLVGALVRLNPLLDYYNAVDREVDRLMFSGLLRFDDRGIPQGDLADSWGISRDGTTYNFSLRPNTTWHDGTPITTDDVIFTIESMRAEGSPLPQDLLSFWKQVQVTRLDERSLQFILPEPFAPFLDYLTFGILPEHLLGALSMDEIIASPFNLAPVGSGPYQFDHLIIEDGQVVGVVLAAFPGYYNTPPFIEQLAFRYYPDTASVLAAYQAGEIAGIGQVTVDILAQALAEPGLNLYTSRLPQIAMVFLNLDNASVSFFQDAEVRRALLMGLNRQGMIDQLMGGQGIIADGPILPGTWAYYEGIARLDYDTNQAITLLRQAGYTVPAGGGSIRQSEDGLPLSFTLLHPDTPEHKALAEAIRQNWALLGVQANLQAVPYPELVSDYLNTRRYEAALVDINLSRSPDPDPYPFWHQAQASSGQNYSLWDDRAASEYLEQARITTDLAERERLYNNFQVRFSQELPALPLYYPVYTYAASTEVQGIRLGPLFDTADRFNSINAWFLVTRRASETEITPTP